MNEIASFLVIFLMTGVACEICKSQPSKLVDSTLSSN